MNRTTVADLLRGATHALRDGCIDGAESDARHLVAAATGIGRDRLTLYLREPVAQGIDILDSFIAARLSGVPVSRILGRRAFYGREFTVTAAVLDPRPETETLVHEALGAPFSSVLDLGTGSGCILISLLAERPRARGLGVDISAGALETAVENAAQLGVADRAQFVLSDWWTGITGRYDLIVSNPPYIAAAEMPGLAREVRDHDPGLALSDGADGLSAYRALAAGLMAHLVPGGRVLIEIGPTQRTPVMALFAAAGLGDIRCLSDLDGRDRVIAAIAP